MAGFTNKSEELFNSGLKLTFYHIPSNTDVSFKAYITTFQDSFNQSWNKEKSIGRTDPWHNYENTERVINIGWDIIAESLGEAQLNLIKIGQLAQMSYPKYDQELRKFEGTFQNATAITEAPVFKLKFVNLIASAKGGSRDIVNADVADFGLPGRIEGGLSFSHNIDEGYLQDISGSVYPKSISVSCQYEVLHDHALGWSAEKLFRGSEFYPYFDSVIEDNPTAFSEPDYASTENQDPEEAILNSLEKGNEQELEEAIELMLLNEGLS